MSDALTARVVALEARLADLEKKIGNGATSSSSSGGGSVADDADLDGQWGDPEIKKDPPVKYWSGADCKGMRMSDCPPEYLDAFAKWKDACAYMADKNAASLTGEEAEKKRRYAGYDRRDAARARGHAKRIRERGAPTRAKPAAAPAQSPEYADFGGSPDDEIPF